MSEAVSLLHSCKHPKRVRQANLTSAREQLAAIKSLASAQLSAELEMSPDILVFECSLFLTHIWKKEAQGTCYKEYPLDCQGQLSPETRVTTYTLAMGQHE